MDKLLLTPEEAAETMSIGRTKVYELLALGELASIQVGKSRRIPVAAINDLIERLSQLPGSGPIVHLHEHDTAS